MVTAMNILGISAYYHDSAAALLVDGQIAAAAQEERFSRVRHDSSFPLGAINFCLNYRGLRPSDIDYVVFYDKPFLKFDRLMETYLAFAPRGLRNFITSFPVWIKEKLFQKSVIIRALSEGLGQEVDWERRLLFSEHHLSHAASAFFPSPFREAAVLTMDGVGEWTTTSLAIGNENRLQVVREIHFPHSIGLLYSAFTYYTGFRVNSGEYKVMGLAPYGTPRYAGLIRDHLIDIREDGTFHLNLEYFNFCTGLTMTSERFHSLFGGPPRRPESRLTDREMDLAASIQAVTEEVVLRLGRSIRRESGQTNLCLAGGVALNCVANGRLKRENIFERIWIQPAAGDAGGAIGAALAAHYLVQGSERRIQPGDSMNGACLGPAFEQNEIEERLRRAGAVFTTHSEEEMIQITAESLREGKAVGWHQGRMEYGPRALGCRSILADPRSPTIQRQLNLKVKFRESFRPFAPSVLAEEVDQWFEFAGESPYMLMVANVISGRQIPLTTDQKRLFGIDLLNVPRSTIPAVTHVDYSARIQTVHRETNPLFHRLISAFRELTGCPVLVNTSFNVRGEPIVCTPEDAFQCLLGTEIDLLAIGNSIVIRNEQDSSLIRDYRHRYELD